MKKGEKEGIIVLHAAQISEVIKHYLKKMEGKVIQENDLRYGANISF